MDDSYSGFAYIYDRLMQDIDYDAWVDYIEAIFDRCGVTPKLVLELACGTGNICCRMAQRGYDMIGIDLSQDMLNIAVPKAEEKDLDILYLQQDMREFELYGTVDAVLCLIDSVNYITQEKDLIQVFKLVRNYLNPGGLFIFDINSAHKLKEIIGSNTFVVNEDDIFYVWENNYDEKDEICEFFLTFFVKEGRKYNRIDEYHREKAYSTCVIKDCLKKAGLYLVDIYEPFSFQKPMEKSERIFFVAQRKD